MRVVESVIAILVVVSAVTFLYFFAATPSSQPQDTSELEKIGHNVLHDIDEQQLLARYVYNSEWANFTAALVVSLPTNVYFNLSIYDINHRSIGHVPGTFVTKKVKDEIYYYFQYSDPGGIKRQLYIGRKDSSLDRVVRSYQKERAVFEEDAAGVQRLMLQWLELDALDALERLARGIIR
jgi:hypothetical protein